MQAVVVLLSVVSVVGHLGCPHTQEQQQRQRHQAHLQRACMGACMQGACKARWEVACKDLWVVGLKVRGRLFWRVRGHGAATFHRCMVWRAWGRGEMRMGGAVVRGEGARGSVVV